MKDGNDENRHKKEGVAGVGGATYAQTQPLRERGRGKGRGGRS